MKIPSKDFELLIKALSPGLYRLAFALSRHWHLAGSLVQESLLRARLFTLWCNAHARLHGRQRPIAQETSGLRGVPGTGHAYSTAAFALGLALTRSAPGYRVPLLQVIAGFSCAETGQILQIPTNTARTRVFGACNRLRRQLEGPRPRSDAHALH